MELNEKEITSRDNMIKMHSKMDPQQWVDEHYPQGLFYNNVEMSFLDSPKFINLREECKDLAEFKRRITYCDSDEEVEKLAKSCARYLTLFGYMKHYGIKED